MLSIFSISHRIALLLSTRMASMTDPTYSGSRLLTPLADFAGLPLDQVNFVASQLIALLLAPAIRIYLHPQRVSCETRQTICLIFGIIMSWFCFGYQSVHIAAIPIISYIIMCLQDKSSVHKSVLIVSMSYLSLVHLYNQFVNKSTITVDISGPVMVVTQKVTSLAFSLHDGTKNPEKLKPMQAYHAVKKLPAPLEYFSFVLQFQTLLAGPLVLYNDYIDYITGTTLMKCRSEKKGVMIEPSPTKDVIKKATGSIMCLILFLWMMPMFPIERLKEPEFLSGQGDVPAQIIYLVVSTSVVRLKYYHAWILADAISNASGLGLKVPNTPGQLPTWDLISNVNVKGFEMGLTLRDSVNEWNKGTSTWLRLLVYERTKSMPTLQTYALSAIWHGFHPGYYLTFISGALFTIAARSARRCLRHHFLSSPNYKHMYDCLTFLATRILMGYVTFPFVLLELKPCIRIYNHMYWWYHLAAIVAVSVLHIVVPPPPPVSNNKDNNEGKLAAALEDNEGNIDLVAAPDLIALRRRILIRDFGAGTNKLFLDSTTALVTE